MSGFDPTARGDMKAELLRQWYEKNRESWWTRRFGIRARHSEAADEFALGLLQEARRIDLLTDAKLLRGE